MSDHRPKRQLRRTQRIADAEIKTTVPRELANKFDQLALRECSTVAALARRLIARGVERELAALEAQ